MTDKANMHAFTEWVRSRLDEMDAGLDAMEKTMASLDEQGRQKASQMLDDMKKWRADFDARAKEAEAQGQAAWDTSRQQLDMLWGEFEEGFQNWAQVAQMQGEAFQARTKAQLDLWQSMLQKSREKAEAAHAEHKATLKAEIERATKDAEAARERLEQAGAAGWAAMSEALDTSRKAFEKAAEDMRNAFTQAGGKPGGEKPGGS